MNKNSQSEIVSLPDFRYVNQGELIKIWILTSLRQLKNSWRIFSRNRLAVLGLVLLFIFIAMALLHPILIQTIWSKNIYDPIVGFDVSVFINPSSPTLKHPLGTDTLGRDVLSMLMAAAIPSLTMTITAALTSAVLGTLIGAFSAYFRGSVDGFFSHLSDLTMLTPAPLVMVLIGFTLDISPGWFGLIYGILVGVGVVAIVLRAHALTVVNKVFIDAARVAGGSPMHITFKHLIPHLIPLATVNMLFTVTGVIFANGFIAFLGLTRANLNWGSMIYDSFTYQGLNGIIPWNVFLSAALAISLFAASFYMIALGLQDVTNPRLSENMFGNKPIPVVVKPENLGAKPSMIESLGNKLSIERVDNQISNWDQETEVSPGKPISITSTSTIYPTKQWVTVIIYEFFGSDLDNPSESSIFLSQMEKELMRRKVKVAKTKDGIYIASFGIASPAPPRASALMAVITGIRIFESFNEFNNHQIHDGKDVCRLGMGISLDEVVFNDEDRSSWYKSVMTSEVGQVALTLCAFTKFMRHGSLLICESTYKYLASVQHIFKFGRHGYAKFPENDEENIIYEVIGYSS